jgi:hypothetical protein
LKRSPPRSRANYQYELINKEKELDEKARDKFYKRNIITRPRNRTANYVMTKKGDKLHSRGLPVPKTLDEALNGEYKEYWSDSIKSEYDSLKEHGTFKAMKKEKGIKEISTKLVFDIKTDSEGYVTRFKTRLVARGYTHKKE